MADAYDPETVRRKLDAFPELFADHRVVEIPDAIAADRGTHEPGETLFVARVREVDESTIELADVYRVTERPDGTPGSEPAPHLYFVAKQWTDVRFDRADVQVGT
ncbi:MAG: hypothetical protein ABEI96_07995 [Haloarculaceae archaeon]